MGLNESNKVFYAKMEAKIFYPIKKSVGCSVALRLMKPTLN